MYAQTIAGKDAPSRGEAKNSWFTGTAAWNYVAITQWILGIRADYDGLRVHPCLPSDWTSFDATRRFRGAAYRIHVRNPPGTQTGPFQLMVDGRPIEGDLVPPAAASAIVDVTIDIATPTTPRGRLVTTRARYDQTVGRLRAAFRLLKRGMTMPPLGGYANRLASRTRTAVKAVA